MENLKKQVAKFLGAKSDAETDEYMKFAAILLFIGVMYVSLRNSGSNIDAEVKKVHGNKHLKF